MLRYLQDMMLDTVFNAFNLTNNIYKNDIRGIMKRDNKNSNEVQCINSFTDNNMNMNEETENDYEIFVYHNPPTSTKYDRLVGYAKVNSLNRLGR